MKQAKFVIGDPDGIHARPAGILVKRMQEFPCAITIEKDGRQADGKKLFSLMKLSVKKGETIAVTTDGPQEEEALQAFEQVFSETGL